MNTHPARRLGLLGLVLLIGWLGPAGDRRSAVDDAHSVVDRALQGATQRPPADTPFLRGVSWTDIGPDDTFEGWVDSVSRRPRRAGAFTLRSYYEIVAVNVRMRVTGAGRSDHAPRAEAARNTFQQLDRTRVALQDMTRDGSGAEPGPGVHLARTFLSGVVVERFSLEGPRGEDGGHLRSRLMTTAQGGNAWSLQEVHVQAADGKRLTIAGAEWRKNGSLVATGPYTIEKGGTRRAGPRGCFLIHIDGPVSFRQVPSINALCAPPIPPTRSEPWSPAIPVFREDGRDARAAWPVAIFLQPLLHSLATAPAGAPSEVTWRPQR